jgi:hypothetical protein
MRIPAIVDPIPVTGENVIYGDFNGSGSIKLTGPLDQIFGVTSDKASESISRPQRAGGFWWANISTHFNHPDTNIENLHLSAAMLKSTYVYPPIGKSMFISGNSLYGYVNIGQPEIVACDKGSPVQGIEQSWKHRNAKVKSYSDFTRFSMVYPLASSNLLKEDYAQTESDPYPNYIDYTFIFPGDYPSQDTYIGGMAISQSYDFSIDADDCFVGLFYSKIQTGDSAWIYKFNSPQLKPESQLIEVKVRFSANRDEI